MFEGFEGFYKINRKGEIKSVERQYPHTRNPNILVTKKEKFLKSKTSNKGYKQISLCKEGKVFYKVVHRLVAEAFILNPENKPEVNHKNGKKWDNRKVNLEWITSLQNKRHACKNKLNAYGEKCNLSKLTEKQVTKLRKLKGKYKVKDLAKMFGITRLTVYRILKGKLWKQLKA